MPIIEKDERDLLDVLRAELEFLEKGGYGRSPREPWVRPMIFQDSPACMNYDSKDNPGPCEECVLMQLVPSEQRAGNIPCHKIPLNTAGDTLESLYRYAEDRDVEEIYGKWLREVIERVEQLTRGPSPTSAADPAAPVVPGIALHQNLHPKCANPACPAAFVWNAGGKFFRFREIETAKDRDRAATTSKSRSSHGVKHYWLCDRCARVFTLTHCTEHGVVVQFRRLALASANDVGQTSAA